MTTYEIEMAKTKGKPRSPHWSAVRHAFLLANPTCRACGGKDHVEVHHKKPFHLHPELELVVSNLITLCELPGHFCHFRVGHGFDWRLFNKMVVEDARYDLRRLLIIHGGKTYPPDQA